MNPLFNYHRSTLYEFVLHLYKCLKIDKSLGTHLYTQLDEYALLALKKELRPTPVSRLEGNSEFHIFTISEKGIFIHLHLEGEIKFYCNVRVTPEQLKRLEKDECANIIHYDDNLIGLGYEYLIHDDSFDNVEPMLTDRISHEQFVNKFFDYNFEFVTPWQIIPRLCLSYKTLIRLIKSNTPHAALKAQNADVLRVARRFSQCSYMHDLIDLEPDTAIGHIDLNDV
jgi:hypothetical protein